MKVFVMSVVLVLAGCAANHSHQPVFCYQLPVQEQIPWVNRIPNGGSSHQQKPPNRGLSFTSPVRKQSQTRPAI